MSDLLFSLPHYLICDVLGNWVGLKAVVRLDSVYVNKDTRESFLATLKSRELVITDHNLYSDDFPGGLVEWCLKRSVKFSVFAFGFQTCTAVSPAQMEQFFKLTGPTLKSFVMHSDRLLNDTPWLKGLAEECSALEVLEIEKEDTGSEDYSDLLRAILCKHSKTLQKFDISCGSLDIYLPVDSSFPVLKELHPRDGNSLHGLSEFVSTCLNLQRFTTSLGLCDYDMSFLNTLATCCPHLNSINFLDITPEVIPEVIEFCPRGPALHLGFDRYVIIEEEEILSVVTSLTNIQSLTFAASEVEVTDKVLMKIKQHCSKTLRKLSLQDSTLIRFNGLVKLVKACKNLNILYLNNCCEFTTSQLCQIVRVCPELTSLTLLYCTVDDAVLATIGECLSNLTHLNIEDDHERLFGDYTLHGLYYVLAGCFNLKTLCLGAAYEDFITNTVPAQLKVLHPKVEILGPELTADYFEDNSDEIM